MRSPGNGTSCFHEYSWLALVPLGIFYSHTWLVWAALLFFFALRHPTIFDDTPLDRNRVSLGLAALLVFLLTFTLVPIR